MTDATEEIKAQAFGAAGKQFSDDLVNVAGMRAFIIECSGSEYVITWRKRIGKEVAQLKGGSWNMSVLFSCEVDEWFHLVDTGIGDTWVTQSEVYAQVAPATSGIQHRLIGEVGNAG